MAEVTFRDFAGAVMQNDAAAAARVLKELLSLDDGQSTAAAAHFFNQMKSAGQAFMMKAMGLRTAVESGNDDAIRALLGECFGLEGDAAATSVTALRTRYPR